MVPFYFKKKTGQLKFAASYKLICKPVTPPLEALSYSRKVDGCTALHCTVTHSSVLYCRSSVHCTTALHLSTHCTALGWSVCVKVFSSILSLSVTKCHQEKVPNLLISLFHKYIWLCIVYKNSCISSSYCTVLICHHCCLQTIKYHMKPINITVVSHLF